MKKYYNEIKTRIILGSFFKFLEACMEVTLPFLMGTAVHYGIIGSAEVWKPIGLLFLFVVVGYCFAFVCQYQASVAQARIAKRLRGEVYKKSVSISADDYKRVGMKKMTILATNDIERVAMAVAMLIRIVPRTPFIALGSVVMLFVLNWKVAVLFLCVLPFLALLIARNTKRLLPKTVENQRVLEKISGVGRETAEGILQIHGANLENTVDDSFGATANDLRRVSKEINKINGFFSPATTLFVNLCVVAVLIFANTLVLGGSVDVAHLSTFVTYMLQLGLAVSVLVSTFNIMSRGLTSSNRIGEFLATADFESGFDGDGSLNCNSEVVMKVDNFSMSQGGFKINDVTFDMKRGEKIGVVGRTGSGKSLLFEGVLKFASEFSGNVEILGGNTCDVPRDEILKHVGFASQKAVIFGGTLESNLYVGESEKSKAEMKDKVEEVKKIICPFVIDKEKNGETKVLEGGVNLSGGQKQRLALARMVAKNKDILILDDSLSALDSETSRNVRNYIFETCENVIILSQKIKDVMHCDKIIVMENGEMIGYGVHADLIASCGIYAEFCELQGVRL